MRTCRPAGHWSAPGDINRTKTKLAAQCEGSLHPWWGAWGAIENIMEDYNVDTDKRRTFNPD